MVVETEFWLLQKETHQDSIGLMWKKQEKKI